MPNGSILHSTPSHVAINYLYNGIVSYALAFFAHGLIYLYYYFFGVWKQYSYMSVESESKWLVHFIPTILQLMTEVNESFHRKLELKTVTK